ncbi:thioredoxin domain-containing protein [Virgibacillus dakarensis]|nr:thioredoxin domain-containing protein [Virgibacillus dakarensis]
MQSYSNSNRLIHEKSPYLLQHAHNEVDWYPWGKEAFNKAKQENKPIFLSIGYSTCHWCHVMAHESFRDKQVANLLNEHYIAIKVDREERPDVDAVYMKVCQMMTGQGGWPLTIFMTPDKIPFYAGTYFPKESKYGRPGLVEALTQLHKKYTNDPGHINKVTKSVTEALQKTVTAKSTERLTLESANEAFDRLRDTFDVEYGGFGAAPKFPAPQNLLFLMRQYHFTGDTAALAMVEKTLQSMADGGIYDHVGFGFSRYSTDRAWLVPHFEKMLYDNALLLMAFTECYQVTKKPFYKKIAEQIVEFVMREMTSPDSAFFSAIDADSEGVEGKYYVWEYEEIFDVLGEELGDLYTTVYNMTPYGNFEEKNIPNLINTNVQEVAEEFQLTPEGLQAKLEQARHALLAARKKRVYPHVDDKILTSWNALMIAALAKAGKVFNKKHYLIAAEKALAFIEDTLFQDDRLKARYRDGEIKYNAYIDDYAYLLWAYLELYDTTFSLDHLKKGRRLADSMIDLFWDNDHGGFYFNGNDSEELISREKEVYDGALPSGNSVASVQLVRLGFLTGEAKYRDKAEEMYSAFYQDLHQYAHASTHFLQSLLLTENPTKEVVILGDEIDPDREKLLSRLKEQFLPHVTILASESAEDFAGVASFAAEYKKIGDKTTVYVCENFACKQPTTDVNEALHNISIR